VTATVADWFIEPQSPCRLADTEERREHCLADMGIGTDAPHIVSGERSLRGKAQAVEFPQGYIINATFAVQSLGGGMNIVEYPAHRAISSRSPSSTGVFGHGFRQHICHPAPVDFQ